MPLIVYKSSAGSGKTTTLVNEYLKIALNNPGAFRHILAITFTNKAANEMKERVIESLKNLADTNSTLSPKLSGLVHSFDLDINILRKRAQKLLSLILHNYDEFAISTIDSFIHRVIRTFATDVQLPQNFEVVIDEEEIIPDIIHNLYDKVGSDKELTKVLINFVLAEADEENSYDPTSKLVAFVKHHMKEDGFQYISKLDNLNLGDLNEIILRLRKKTESEKSKIIQIASEAINICYANNLDVSDFFSGKNGIMSYFIKLMKFDVVDEKLFPGKQVEKTITQDKWEGSKSSTSAKFAISQIKTKLTSSYTEIQKILSSYYLYRLIYSKIYSLALVHEIRALFSGFTEQTGKVHISEFNKKISNEIADQPIPFIYERLGRKYQHFLVDEFQDTSVLQWYNLLPLIEESLSYGNLNLLVGDAKQAIYRFRNGEVELFSSLPDLYNNDGSQLSLSRQNLLHREFKETVLSTNWRSQPEIIKFNNDFFKTITEPLSERTKLIYKDLDQKIPNNGEDGGLVSLNFIEEDNAEKYEQEKLLKIQDFTQQLITNGFQEKDICILCRAGKNVINIAGFLIENGYNVISSESLLLTNSRKVRLIISFLKLVNYPDDELATAEFLDNYLNIIPGNRTFDTELRAIRNSNKQGIDRVFNQLEIKNNSSDLSGFSTYETAEFVLRSIIHQESADIFIQYLLDFILETNLQIDDFILRWEDKKEKLFITMPEDIDAIQVMTIHKAKGLDFPAVIVDAANINPQNTKSEYWDDILIEGFEDLKVGLFPLNSKIKFINKEHIYEKETAKTELDFLNIIYVAFTRPVKALYTVAQIKSSKRKDRFAEYMIHYLKHKGFWDDNKHNYNFGMLEQKKKSTSQINEDIISLNTFISSRWQDLISVASSDDIIHEALTGISAQSYGKLIHKILSEITTQDDISHTMDSLKTSGLFNTNDIDIFEDTITKVVSHPGLAKYFQAGLIIKNETELMLSNGEIVRPDRVVIDNQVLTIIDYKTGEEKKEDYIQLKKYSDAFSGIGYKAIETKVVYIGDVIRVVSIPKL